jgi:hypothetical protein
LQSAGIRKNQASVALPSSRKTKLGSERASERARILDADSECNNGERRASTRRAPSPHATRPTPVAMPAMASGPIRDELLPISANRNRRRPKFKGQYLPERRTKTDPNQRRQHWTFFPNPFHKIIQNGIPTLYHQ